jgi:2-polyprenyl-3-methyl-5-hydroxy-6-metoxy-1,4-benzoquinol methylase
MSGTRDDRADLDAVRRTFEEFGRQDPMYAALSRPGHADNRWDADAFFETGRHEIADVMELLATIGRTPAGARALDFGCAVGRLSQALAAHFSAVVGVDIAHTMVERARDFNRHGDRVTYIVNTAPDLSLFDDGSFDFIYSNKVLQHVPPTLQQIFVREFVRLLRPGGTAVFQLRNGPAVRSGTVRAWLYTLNRVYIRRITQRLRGKPLYEMHYLARSLVEEAVADAGGEVVAVVDLSRGRPNRSLRYCVTRRQSDHDSARAEQRFGQP